MIPSDPKRRLCLKMTNFKTISFVWQIFGAIFVAVGVICLLLLSGVSVESEAHSVPGWIFGPPIVTFGTICILIAKLFIPFIYKQMDKGVINYPVSSMLVNKCNLLGEAARTNCGMGPNFKVEVFDDWIDISLNWRNCVSVGSSISKNVSTYKKMILIKDDYTFEELDYECIGSVDLALNNFHASKEIKCGKIRRKQFEYNFGKDLNTGKSGINSYTLDTIEITNQIHKWLAEYGYKPA